MKNLGFFFSVNILLGLLVGGHPVIGQESPAPDSTINERIQALDQKVQELEKRLQSEKKSNGTSANVPVAASAGKDGFTLKSSDGDYLLNLKGVFQFDSFFFDQDNPTPKGTNGAFSYAPSTFNPRKVRLYFEGTVAKYYDFRLLPDFGNGQTVLQDAYLDIHYWPDVRLKGGKFKSPVGLERIQDETSLTFFERALPTNLVPNRDVGILLHGDPWNGTVSYALGIVNGVADNALLDTDPNTDKDGVARIFISPFKGLAIEPLKGLGIGVSGTYGNQQQGTASSPNLPVYRTAGQTTFFSYALGVVSNGQHIRYSPQANYYWGPFGFIGEYAISSQYVTTGSNTISLTHSAWQAAISYVLTGEKASYYGLNQEHVFDPGNGNWGAIELAARYSNLKIDSNAFPIYASPTSNAAGAREWGGGVNWYLNKNVKVVLDYFDTSFETAS
ncbi:MAG TPA: porin, partial [Nitrospiria bacterium]|nr:porin [Nitrospiria bacterium]